MSNIESSVNVVLCGAQEQEGWNTYIEGSPGATICHHFLWQPIISRAYGHWPLYLMARSGKQVRGVLPLFLVKSRLFGKSLTSMPFLDYGGVCADDEAVAQRLLDHARQVLPEYGAHYVELRQCVPSSQDGVLRLDKFGFRLDLSAGIEAVWQSFPAKVRNQVRKAEKSGLHACVGGAELLDEFYSVFATNMRDLGSPVHDRTFFARIFSEFGQQAKLMLVRDGKRAVGGLVCLFFKDTATVPWASSLREYLPQCPNNLLYWEAIQYACRHNYTCFDFGRSSVGSGTYNFKRQWGAKPVQIYWQILGRNGDSRNYALPANDAKFSAFVALWKRLPIPVTKLIGPRIRRYITN